MSKFGITVTAIYIGVLLVFRWHSLPTLAIVPLSEFGDFFAGVFGPLMLFWLILGYIQQQKELQQNTAALELQAQELKKSVEQHKELVKATREQVEADKQALQISKSKERKSAQPDVAILAAGMTSSQHNKKNYAIRLKNSGKQATSVTFSTDPVIQQVATRPTLQFWDTDSQQQLEWDSQRSGEAPEKLQLIINCKDATNRGYTKMFGLVLLENNEYAVNDVTEVG